MLNFKQKRSFTKKTHTNGYIQTILLQFKSEYAQLLFKPFVFQYKINSKLYECLTLCF